MKKILITLFLLLTFFVFSEEIILKNGSVVNGTIVNETDTSYFVEMPTGILEVAKENVDTVKKDIDFSVPTKTTEIQPINTANSNSPFVSLKDFKNDPNYFAYRHYFAIGLGFLIPGLSLTMTPLLFTPAVVHAFIEQEYEDVSLGVTWATSLYFSCIGVGLILDIISIPMFYLANQYYQKVLSKYRVGVDVRDDKLEISMNVAF